MNPLSPKLVLTVIAAAALAGCNSLDASKDVGHYVIGPPQTPMFRYGPAQSFGPDFNLQQGQHVVMLRKEFGYSRVMTEDGQSGYVATEDLIPAPPPVKVAATRGGYTAPRMPTRGSGGRPGVSSANAHVIESGPLFGADDLPGLPPLPERDNGEPPKPRPEEPKKDAPKPEFRYPKPKPGFRVNVPNPDARP